MSAPTSCDAIIIGSGQAGNPLAVALAGAGRRVVLIEENLLGGSCINYGCTPTKTLLATAERMHHIRTAAEVAAPLLPGAGTLTVDLATAIARKTQVLEALREGVRSNLIDENPGITVLAGHAAFTGPHTVAVALAEGTRELSAPLIFINTGTRTAIPDNIEGLTDSGYHTSTTLMELQDLPEHLLIVGGGYIGLELGQMFRRFGSKVSIVENGPALLEHEDADVSGALQSALEAEGIRFVLGAQARRVSRSATGLTLTAHTAQGTRHLRGSHLLLATGRRPNTDRLGLGYAGIQTDEQGYIPVDSNLQTKVRGVYALGDVHPGPQFTHLAYDDYRIVRDALLHGKRRSARQRPLPYCVFTEPQLARIGLNEAQAREKKVPYRVASMPVSVIGRARHTSQPAGFWKVLVGDDDQLLGAALLGGQAGEVMSVLQVAMTGRLRYQQLQEIIFAHPIWAEGLNNVFRDLRRP
ncbi:mercuric reductase [Hymenobacter saemangeumensis]|uniref:Mercuric reductase n=1 Tax=Hymenobacter saemangeumensis TaxID=1084522 RepID=A0ABP8ILS0_9BACT